MSTLKPQNLAAVDLLRGLSPQELDEVARRLHVRHWPAGHCFVNFRDEFARRLLRAGGQGAGHDLLGGRPRDLVPRPGAGHQLRRARRHRPQAALGQRDRDHRRAGGQRQAPTSSWSWSAAIRAWPRLPCASSWCWCARSRSGSTSSPSRCRCGSATSWSASRRRTAATADGPAAPAAQACRRGEPGEHASRGGLAADEPARTAGDRRAGEGRARDPRRPRLKAFGEQLHDT